MPINHLYACAETPEPTAAGLGVCDGSGRFAAPWLRRCSVSGGCGSVWRQGSPARGDAELAWKMTLRLSLAWLLWCSLLAVAVGQPGPTADQAKPVVQNAFTNLQLTLPAGFHLPTGLRTNNHLVIARYGTMVEVPGKPGAMGFQKPAPGIRIEFKEPALTGEMAAMYYFDAVLLKEQFRQGESADYVYAAEVLNKRFDARWGWLTPDEIIEKIGALFAAEGIGLRRLSPRVFLAVPAQALPPTSRSSK
jgi:hypothetical protein